MPNEDGSNAPPADAERQSFPQSQMRDESKDRADEEENPTTKLERDIKTGEIALIVINGLLLVTTIVIAVIYNGQLKEMRRATRASEKAAIAAAKASDTADATLKDSQKSFEIDQRPYVVAATPEFAGNGLVPDKKLTVNVTFKDIGRTPALKYIEEFSLLRFDATGTAKTTPALWVKFMNASFDKFAANIKKSRKLIDRINGERDIAPNGTIFHSNQNDLAIPSEDFPKIAIGGIALCAAGIAEYTDAFGGKYKTEFCYYFVGTDPKIWHVCESRNTIK